MELRRVVVTGLGALTPIGNNIPEYWEALVSGKVARLLLPILILKSSKPNSLVNLKISSHRFSR